MIYMNLFETKQSYDMIDSVTLSNFESSASFTAIGFDSAESPSARILSTMTLNKSGILIYLFSFSCIQCIEQCIMENCSPLREKRPSRHFFLLSAFESFHHLSCHKTKVINYECKQQGMNNLFNGFFIKLNLFMFDCLNLLLIRSV